MKNKKPILSFIVPVANAKETIGKCLEAIFLSDIKNYEVIVVFDGPQDKKTISIVNKFKLKIIKNKKSKGEAAAKNKGASLAKANILFFVDADVVINRNAPKKVIYNIKQLNYDVAIGTYNSFTPIPNSISKLRSLWQNYLFNENKGKINSFWSGCVAIRKEVFLATGKFEEKQQFRGMSDVAFGDSLKKANKKIILDPKISSIHLKKWTFSRWIKSDLKERALPWARLLYCKRTGDALLTKGLDKKISLISAILLFLILPISFFCGELLMVVCILILGVVIPHYKFYYYTLKKGSKILMIKSVPFITMRYLILAIALIYVTIIEKGIKYLK